MHLTLLEITFRREKWSRPQIWFCHLHFAHATQDWSHIMWPSIFANKTEIGNFFSWKSYKSSLITVTY